MTKRVRKRAVRSGLVPGLVLAVSGTFALVHRTGANQGSAQAAPFAALLQRATAEPGLDAKSDAPLAKHSKTAALSWATVRRDGARFIGDLESGARAELTIDPRVATLTERVLKEYPAPYSAAVVMSVEDGRI